MHAITGLYGRINNSISVTDKHMSNIQVKTEKQRVSHGMTKRSMAKINAHLCDRLCYCSKRHLLLEEHEN